MDDDDVICLSDEDAEECSIVPDPSKSQTTDISTNREEQTKEKASTDETSCQMKKTARKTVSSFEPRFKKRVSPDVVNIEDDDITPALNGKDIEAQPKQGAGTKRKLSCEVEEAVEQLLAAGSSLMSTTHQDIEALRKRFNKKISTMPNDSGVRSRITKYIRDKTAKIQETNYFILVRGVFQEMDIQSSVKKPKIVDVQVSPQNDSEAGPSNGVASTTTPNGASADLRRRRNIKKLEKALTECHKKIQQLEESEVDLDDEESNFLKMDRYKKQFMRIFNKIAKLSQLDPKLDRRQDQKIKLGDVSSFPEVNARLQKFINRKRKLKNDNGGKLSEFCYFPDFKDVLDIFVEVNNENNLGYPEAQLEKEAASTFRAVVQVLRARRQDDDADVLLSYLPETGVSDPADMDEQLDLRLRKSREEGEQKIAEVMQDFVRQSESLVENGIVDEDETTDEEEISEYAD